MPNSPSFRILDAAANRALEGLRVIEDFVRFALDDGLLTSLLKQLRHDLAEASQVLPVSYRHASRDTQQDVGTEITTEKEASRSDTWDVCQASCERVKQSLRSLEEYSKVDFQELAAKLEALRYRFYTIERTLTGTLHNCSRLGSTQLCVLISGRDSVEEFTELARQLVGVGVPMVQLRDKRFSDAALAERAKLLVKIVKNSESPYSALAELRERPLVIINDRPDIAVVAGADGVHLGQDDLSIQDARRLIGPGKLIGVSTHTLEQARKAVLAGANYLGAGPTFPSQTKQFSEFPGINFLKALATEIRLPTFAIGGIDEQNLPEVLATGIRRIAVSGAISKAENPIAATKSLLKMLDEEESHSSDAP